MDKTWHDKLEQLYHVFSRYPLREKIEGCPCCVRNEDEAPLHQKALRDLDEDDLGVYAAKAMTTWGDVDDYRHFLPRLFELSLTTHHGYHGLDPWMIAGKLAYGDFSSWPAVERRAIDELISDLESVVTDDDDEDPPEGAPLWRKSEIAEFRRELAAEKNRQSPDSSGV